MWETTTSITDSPNKVTKFYIGTEDESYKTLNYYTVDKELSVNENLTDIV